MDFDQNGNLTPYSAIEISFDEFETRYLKAPGASLARQMLSENYLKYVNDFENEITKEFFQFVNGSFTTRKLNPNDLDLVTFIDYRIYGEKESLLERFKRPGEFEGIDAYIEKSYPEDHRFFIRYQTDLLYWNDLFTKNRQGQKKGYFKIFFNHEK